ncbi:hypothetical protein Halar_3571 [halophilic archaeon DL31]|jgi:hypothetical protein|nr:hypothetical protein Halar_3571 [halophilic archaeon DL31]
MTTAESPVVNQLLVIGTTPQTESSDPSVQYLQRYEANATGLDPGALHYITNPYIGY